MDLKQNLYKPKNLNSIGKSSTKYKSSPQVEIVSLFNTEVSLPLIRNTKDILIY